MGIRDLVNNLTDNNDDSETDATSDAGAIDEGDPTRVVNNGGVEHES